VDVAAHIAADHPLLGTGQETYSQVFFQYRDTVLEPAQARLFWGTVPETPPAFISRWPRARGFRRCWHTSV
jgi:hypothetical protein